MDPKLALAQALEALAEDAELFAQGMLTPRDLRYREAVVHRAQAALYRHEAAAQGSLLRAVRFLAGIDSEFLDGITPDAMRRVMDARGWRKSGEMPMPGEPSRVAFEVFDHPTAKGDGRIGIVPTVSVPQVPVARDYGQRVREWATDLAIRQGDVAPAEVLAEAWDRGRRAP